ncbi:TATA element modulatory factor [Dissostichus eleginoides]|uniref:TATA element modulatory factor n=1 Tax=Dissostichus eleginoides TaxID=100907 RepID=A0AAD9CGN7_DISEL|nr:TATA element modulatory factor [Dissostichus eleginoides]
MSWFNSSLSSFAKQALTTAQKSIDRVLDIKEEDQWGDTVVMPYDDVTIPGKLSLSGGWGMTPWEAPPEERTITPPPSSEAITTPVTRTVVDESENFFTTFLPPGDVQGVTISQVVSVPPTKSQRRPQEKEKKSRETVAHEEDNSAPADETLEYQTDDEGQIVDLDSSAESPYSDTILLQPVSPAPSPSDLPDSEMSDEQTDIGSTFSVDSTPEQSQPPSDLQVEQDTTDSCEPAAVTSELKSSTPPDPSPSPPSKEVLIENKDSKVEDRQSDTPSPPVSAFSSGTSTTSDIEVLDHESVLSESSASSRQETGEGKADLHLMQGSFQLLTASTCGDFPHLEDYSKLTESCGSSSDAFERIDSFSVQSLDSRSVSEVNSDDDIPGSRTLASVTTGSPPLTVSSAPEELMEQEQDSEANVTLSDPASNADEQIAPPITAEMKSVSPVQILELQKVIDDLSGRLEKRESQLLVVSKDKATLEEQCDNLKDEVISLKEDSSTVQSLKDEFTQRIADTERKAQLACKERDIAKKEIKGLRDELSTRLHSSDTLEIIREKEEQIRGLLEEGEKITKQQKKIKEQEEELRQLQQVLDGKEEVEKQHRENIKKLNAVVERQENDVSRLQTDSEELQENNRSLQAALDNSYKELAELHKAQVSRASEAQEAALSRETQAKDLLSLALEKNQEEGRMQQEALANQVADLRMALQRAEQQQGRKEDYLREEISELQQRLQEAETRNQELSQSVTSATRPLLRQIENLQASLGGQTASWEKLEKSISDRLADAQAQLAVAVERERSASEELLSIRSQQASLESQIFQFRQEKARLLAQLEAEKNKREKLEDESTREHVDLENLRGEHNRMLEETKKEKLLLTNQLEMERMKVEQEKKKCYLANEALREKERKAMTHSVGEPPASSTPSLSRSSSISVPDNAALHSSILSQEDLLDHSLGNMTMSMSMSGTNLYEAARLSGGSSIMENLQSQLKLREGEIAQLQIEISSLERSLHLKDLQQRHNTILQMYGEKAEEAEELRLDLIDVKNMYKCQIDELLKNQK